MTKTLSADKFVKILGNLTAAQHQREGAGSDLFSERAKAKFKRTARRLEEEVSSLGR